MIPRRARHVLRPGPRRHVDGLRRRDPVEPAPENVITARVADLFAEQDRARMARLNHVVKVLGRCRYCGVHISDTSLRDHPGVCSRMPCRRRARDEAQSLNAAEVAG